MIYTTNTVKEYHRQIRKVTKNKGVFPNDTALEKLVYLAYRNIRKKWTMPLANWASIAQQLAIKFGDRLCRFQRRGELKSSLKNPGWNIVLFPHKCSLQKYLLLLLF